ncbi:hypothetical protein IJ596_04740, partial [bacterium]|nr:hypothetical protein [bacterium]
KYRINKIKKYIDKVLCIFPFEVPLYRNCGIDVEYCGHPLISQLPQPASKIAFFKKHNLDKDKKLVSVFPGSRVFELKYLMSTFKDAVKILQKKHPQIQFCLSQAPNLSDEIYKKFLGDSDIKVIKGENQALLSVSDALILASGTVSLEACLYKTPMIIAYKGPQILYWVYLMVRCIKRVCLPNIIADKSFVPELIQNDAQAENIAKHIEILLFNRNAREEMIYGLSGIKKQLSDKKSSFEVAKAIDRELFP